MKVRAYLPLLALAMVLSFGSLFESLSCLADDVRQEDLSVEENELNQYYAQIYYNYTPEQRQKIGEEICHHSLRVGDDLKAFVDGCPDPKDPKEIVSPPKLKKPIFEKDSGKPSTDSIGRGALTSKTLDELFLVTYVNYCKNEFKEKILEDENCKAVHEALYPENSAPQKKVDPKAVEAVIKNNFETFKSKFEVSLTERVQKSGANLKDANRQAKQLKALGDCRAKVLDSAIISGLEESLVSVIATHECQSFDADKTPESTFKKDGRKKYYHLLIDKLAGKATAGPDNEITQSIKLKKAELDFVHLKQAPPADEAVKKAKLSEVGQLLAETKKAPLYTSDEGFRKRANLLEKEWAAAGGVEGLPPGQGQAPAANNSAVCGFMNFGATCYVNSALKAIATLPKIDELLAKKLERKPAEENSDEGKRPESEPFFQARDSVRLALKELYEKMRHHGPHRASGPESLKTELTTFHRKFAEFWALKVTAYAEEQHQKNAAIPEKENHGKLVDPSNRFILDDGLEAEIAQNIGQIKSPAFQAKLRERIYTNITARQNDSNEYLGSLLNILDYQGHAGRIYSQEGYRFDDGYRRPSNTVKPVGELQVDLSLTGNMSIVNSLNQQFMEREIQVRRDPAVAGGDARARAKNHFVIGPKGIPHEVMFNLKRYSFDPVSGRTKRLDQKVEINSEIEVPFHDGASNKEIKQKMIPSAVVVHLPDTELVNGVRVAKKTANSGHYVTYTYNPGNGKWTLHNDSTVTELEPEVYEKDHKAKVESGCTYIIYTKKYAF